MQTESVTSVLKTTDSVTSVLRRLIVPKLVPHFSCLHKAQLCSCLLRFTIDSSDGSHTFAACKNIHWLYRTIFFGCSILTSWKLLMMHMETLSEYAVAVLLWSVWFGVMHHESIHQIY
jgi:hypothetical protein